MIRLAFHGAARTVTGSKFLLTADADSLLVDCGMFQGLKELRLKNWDKPPFDPRALKAVALTHAHIDHCGYLPRLVREGFSGPIISTPATADILPIMLFDAAKLALEDAKHMNRHGLSKHKPALPLFTREDVETTLTMLSPVDYGANRGLGPKLSLRFIDVGHILGSAMIEVTAQSGGETHRTLFSGDVGRYDTPLPPDPLPPPPCDALVIESTYGDRRHEPADLHDQLARLIAEIVRTQGILLIPAFAVGRSQQLLFILKELADSGRIPKVPVHVDSPMAFKTTDLYLKYMANHRVRMDSPKGGGSIVTGSVKLHRSGAESRQLAFLKGPAVLISSSGMLAGGRILSHLRHFMPRSTTILAIAGYMAEGTRGRALLEGAKTVRVYGQEVEIRGQVVDLDGFSGHADYAELLRWTKDLPKPAAVFVVHGEARSAEAFAARLRGERGWTVTVPGLHQEVVLSP